MLLIKIYRIYRLQKKEVQLQKNFIETFLTKKLTQLEVQYGGTFAPSLIKKIKEYYCILGPTILCASYCRLIGRTLTEDERKKATILSTIAPVYDDFFDNATLTTEQIKQITTDPSGYIPQIFEEKVFCDLQLWMLANVRYPASYKNTFEKIYSAQLDSVKQTNPAITDEELYTITYDKSYYSCLIYLDILNEVSSQSFQKIWYHISGLLQISNDAYDVYKDLQDSIYTLPNLHRDYKALLQHFTGENYRINHLIRALPYPAKQKEDFAITMNFIIARGWVSLRKLDKIVKTIPVGSSLQSLERKQLICDMEKPVNIVRWLFYTYRFSKR